VKARTLAFVMGVARSLHGCKFRVDSKADEFDVKLAADESCNFDARELAAFRASWLKQHPKGKAKKDKLLAFLASAWPAGSAPDRNVLDKIVTALDTNGDGEIDFREAVLGLSAFMRGRHESKVQMLFWAIDVNGNGSISKAELRVALQGHMDSHEDSQEASWSQQQSIDSVATARGIDIDTSMSSSTTAVSRRGKTKRRITHAIDAIFDKADMDGDGELNYEELLKMVENDPTLRLHFTVADKVFDFNVHDASSKKRLVAIKGIVETATQSGLVEDFNAAAAIRVLTTVPGFSPVAIGEFLGSKDADGFTTECANLFFATFRLKGMQLDEAVRKMSTKLCLPRESQQIDRLMQAFSAVYHRDNPETFADADAVYLTSFAIVMLNADAHSANVTKKMTKAQFVKNAGLATPNLDKKVLEGIYARVSRKEIKLGVIDSGGTMENALSGVGGAELSMMLNAMADTETLATADTETCDVPQRRDDPMPTE